MKNSRQISRSVARTSASHPLHIAEVEARPGLGKIGITLCPGKTQMSAMTGPWNRDLGADLEVIANFGTAILVSLIEDHEIESLGVQSLGEETALRHMDWFHLPIRDVSIPGPKFEVAWRAYGPILRKILRQGFSVVLHCKGGLGRSGTIAARLLVELGVEPEQAIRKVRRARPGAIETYEQENYVRKQRRAEELNPATNYQAIADRASGALLGLAVGDAVGTTLEFKARDSYAHLTDMIGGGPFGLKAGQWTDDTAMALALTDSLIAYPEFSAEDLMRRFIAWRDTGAYSCTGTCFDIGNTVGASLRRWQKTGEPFAGSTDPYSAGNGSLMRLSPVAIRYWRNGEALQRVARQQSQTTHGAPEAVTACVAYANLLADAIAGSPSHAVLVPKYGDYAGQIADIMRGSWKGKKRHEIASLGYVAHSLKAALWSIGRTSDFRSAVLTAANLGGDADTTAAIVGQLAGAIYGASGIPNDWLSKLAWKEEIEAKATKLFASSL